LFQQLGSVDESLQWLLEKGEDPALDAPLTPRDWAAKPAAATKKAFSSGGAGAGAGGAEVAVPEGCQQLLITGSRLGVTLSNDKESGQLCALEVRELVKKKRGRVADIRERKVGRRDENSL